MIGPSSSHTAGAVRIGNVARRLLGDEVAEAEIILMGSFAETGKGHGTDKALLAGLMGYLPDDESIKEAYTLADKRALRYHFAYQKERGSHPNSTRLLLKSKNGHQLKLLGESLGGGKINIAEIDGIKVNFSGEYNTLIIHNLDVPGHVVLVSSKLVEKGINIANMQLFRNKELGFAVMIIECDQRIDPQIAEKLAENKGILKVTIFNKEDHE